MHIYRWDLDKTYLETDIHSVRGLVRAALEKASQKRNVPGSAALLRALIDWDDACRVAILSGSPTQMRNVLEEKLALDGIRFDTLVLKDNVGNIRRGRLRAVTGQIGYKLPALLRQRKGVGAAVRETLFGDDAEVDAVIYSIYADAVAGRISEEDVARIMEVGGAYGDSIEAAVHAMRQIGRADAVEDIFIRVDRGVPIGEFRRLGPRVIPVFSWLQAAVMLWKRGRLGPRGVEDVARAVSEAEHLADAAVAGLVQDLVRRGVLARDDVTRLLEEASGLEPVRPSVERALARLGAVEPPAPVSAPRYIEFLQSVARLQ